VNKLLEVRGLAKSFAHVDVVKDGSLDLYPGEFISLLGRSGSGKSTLLYMLAGLEQADQGDVLFQGKSIIGYNQEQFALWRRKHVGLVFQNFNLIPTLNAAQNVAFPLYPEKMNSKERMNRALEVLEQVGLADRAAHRPQQLSGGEQQRVSIARALVNRPSIIFADEPTGNLDSKTGDLIMSLFRNLSEQHGVGLLVVTHDEEKVASKSDRKIKMVDGRTMLDVETIRQESV
jgi:putative ABC transport system ATP-binding protein